MDKKDKISLCSIVGQVVGIVGGVGVGSILGQELNESYQTSYAINYAIDVAGIFTGVLICGIQGRMAGYVIGECIFNKPSKDIKEEIEYLS